jgi:polyisoprenoid-binding protein YceI
LSSDETADRNELFRPDPLAAARVCGTNIAVPRSPFLPVLGPLVGLVASLARWLLQGSGNVWTALAKRFVIPDPDLGWRPSQLHPIWLGLDVCAVIAAIAVGLVLGALIIRRREAKRGTRASVLRAAAWLIAMLPLVPPIAAFASGAGPLGGRDSVPLAANGEFASGFSGRLDAPAGTYAIAPAAGNAVVAHLSAGKETFDARFTGELRGQWHGDPHDLAAPSTASVSVAASSVDTGIDERSKHAREEYLLADKFPRIELTIDRVLGATPAGPDAVGVRAHGVVMLMGHRHEVEVTGTLRHADAAALARLGLTGDVLLLQADLAIPIRETALARDAGDFDGDRFPIHASLVLRRTGDGA